MAHETFPFKFPKGCYFTTKEGVRVKLESAAIRETDGKDEETAAVRARAKGGAASATEEIVAASLTEVNDDPVNAKGPYQGFDTWNSRSRQFAVAAWNKINGAGKDELDAFLAAVGETAAPTASDSE